MRVLIVDNDKQFNQNLVFFLQNQGVLADSAYTAEEASELSKCYDYDSVFLELTLPDISGGDMLRRWRFLGIKTPIIMLSTVSSVHKKIECLQSGADDYIVKPCDKNELFARLKAVVRRWHGCADATVRVGKMEINLETKMVTISGHPLHLTGKEYAMISFLAMRKGMTVSKEQFLNQLYGMLDAPDVKIIDVFLFNIRKKIDKISPDATYIQTAWGRGYELKEVKKNLL